MCRLSSSYCRNCQYCCCLKPAEVELLLSDWVIAPVLTAVAIALPGHHQIITPKASLSVPPDRCDRYSRPDGHQSHTYQATVCSTSGKVTSRKSSVISPLTPDALPAVTIILHQSARRKILGRKPFAETRKRRSIHDRHRGGRWKSRWRQLSLHLIRNPGSPAVPVAPDVAFASPLSALDGYSSRIRPTAAPVSTTQHPLSTLSYEKTSAVCAEHHRLPLQRDSRIACTR